MPRITLPATARTPLSVTILALAGLAALLSYSIWRTPVRVGQPLITSHRLAAGTPPWIYGRPGARFTIIEYADLECPFCSNYFPALKAWIDEHPDTNWQWNHLPLAIHEPAATEEARLTECAGALSGNDGFWRMTAWVYQHTRGNGGGIPADVPIPGMSAALRACMTNTRSLALIRAQTAAAEKDQISATPTLLIRDSRSGKTVTLQGPVEGDILSSAIDWLTESPAGPQSP
jgi:protein-disulfide isomerase